MARHIGDGDLADEPKALKAEEAQRLTCLVVIVVQRLIAILWDPRVQARLILQGALGTRSLHLGMPVSRL